MQSQSPKGRRSRQPPRVHETLSMRLSCFGLRDVFEDIFQNTKKTSLFNYRHFTNYTLCITTICCSNYQFIKISPIPQPIFQPVIEKVDGGFKVKVGDVAHPMEEKHWIEFIEIIADGKVYRQYLNPGDKPEAVFMIAANQVTAREYCNLHGLWKA